MAQTRCLKVRPTQAFVFIHLEENVITGGVKRCKAELKACKVSEMDTRRLDEDVLEIFSLAENFI